MAKDAQAVDVHIFTANYGLQLRWKAESELQIPFLPYLKNAGENDLSLILRYSVANHGRQTVRPSARIGEAPFRIFRCI